MNPAKLSAAFAWARSLQLSAHVSPHHERAVAELWPWLESLGIQTALEVGAGEPPHLTARMLRNHGIDCMTLDGLASCDVQGDMHDLPFDDETFDLVIARNSLEHVLIPYLALMEMRRVTKRWLLIVLPALCDKFIRWPDHLYVMSREMWERAFVDHMRLRVVQFAEGDFTEQYALDDKRWQDLEWRWLLEKRN